MPLTILSRGFPRYFTLVFPPLRFTLYLANLTSYFLVTLIYYIWYTFMLLLSWSSTYSMQRENIEFFEHIKFPEFSDFFMSLTDYSKLPLLSLARFIFDRFLDKSTPFTVASIAHWNAFSIPCLLFVSLYIYYIYIYISIYLQHFFTHLSLYSILIIHIYIYIYMVE